jgi:hypothetical protein
MPLVYHPALRLDTDRLVWEQATCYTFGKLGFEAELIVAKGAKQSGAYGGDQKKVVVNDQDAKREARGKGKKLKTGLEGQHE